MNDDLKQTYYCDYGHPSIQQLAKQLKNDDCTKTVMDTFTYVRDCIPFGFDLVQTKASQTLKRGFGVCWNKSLLLLALLRSNGIPSHFGSIPMKSSFIAPVVGKIHLLINNPYNHCIVSVKLDGRWVILDPVLDRKSYDTFFRPLNVGWDIDWNGIDDCSLYTESVIGLPEKYPDVDSILNRKVGNTEYPSIVAKPLNDMINRSIWKKTGIKPEK